MNNSAPCFIDIEASGLYPESFPIEIAWGSQLNQIKSFLINPKEIKDWQGHWDMNAQDMHGITREELEKNGVKPAWLSKMMNLVLPEVVYSDNHNFDAAWIKELFYVSGKLTPAFKILDARKLCIDKLLEIGNDQYDFDAHRRAMWRLLESEGLRQHRAANDVAALIKMADQLEIRV